MSSLNDPLRGLHIFVVAAETLSFVEASERLGVTRSAVGKAIARLEDRLNVRLFHRSTRTLALTAEGRYLLTRCTQILDDLRSTEAELLGRSLEPTGEIRIDLPELLGREKIMPILLQLAERHSGLSFTITFNNRRVELIEEGYDLTVRIGKLDDSFALASRPLGHQATILCASPDYLARKGTPARVADLFGHDLLLEYRDGRPKPWSLTDEMDQPVKIQVEGRLKFGHVSAILGGVAAGAGIGMLPSWLVSASLKCGSLVPVLSETATPRLPVSALWPRSRLLASKQRVVIDALRHSLNLEI